MTRRRAAGIAAVAELVPPPGGRRPAPALAAPMAAVTHPRELLGPRPGWFARRRFAAWSGSPTFVGWVLWDHFADDDAEEGKQLWITLARRIAPPYDFVLDLRRLTSISRGAFERIREFARTDKPGMRRMAILASEETHGGAIQVGLFVLRPPRYPWRAFTAAAAAARWLERPEAGALLARVDELTTGVEREPPLLDAIRALLDADPTLTFDEIARRVSRSRRSVQRSLHDQRTSFLAERERARVRRAQDLLRDDDAKLEAVAAAIGCADRRSLNRLFRRVTGETPAEFRRRQAPPA